MFNEVLSTVEGKVDESFSLVGETSDGIEVYETSEDLNGLSYIEKINVFRQNFYDENSPHYLGKKVRFQLKGETYFAEIDRFTQRENTNKINPGRLNQWDKAKINMGASGDFLLLLENSRYKGREKNTNQKKNDAHKKTDSFDYFVKTIYVDGKPYNVVVNIRREFTGGKFVYEVKLKKNKEFSQLGPQTEIIRRRPKVQNTRLSENSKGRIPQTDPPVKKDTESYSIPENSYTEYDKPITMDDVNILRSIGRKSINDFTSEDIKKSQKWAHKFYKELGTKSPFFRAWFGDWRASQNEDFVSVLSTVNKEGKNPRGEYRNNDTGWNIVSSSVGYDETISHSGKDKLSLLAMRNIDKIIENAILLDTEISEYGRGKKSIYTAFMHKFYVPIKIAGKLCIAKMAVDESYSPGHVETNKKIYHVRSIEIETPSSVEISDEHYTPIIEDDASKVSISELFSLVKQYDKEFNPKSVNHHLLNEDGTPKVFYHGTPDSFNRWNGSEETEDEAFTVFELGHGDSKNPSKAGTYFTDSKKLADYYTLYGGETTKAKALYVVSAFIGEKGYKKITSKKQILGASCVYRKRCWKLLRCELKGS